MSQPATASTSAFSNLSPVSIAAQQDLIGGLMQWRVVGRLGWQEIRRRYRRTVIGPFWSAISIALFVVTLGSLGVGLWNQRAADYIPYLTAGLVVWVLVQVMVQESCALFVNGYNFLSQLRFNYSVLAYALVWRNLVVFLHNLTVYVVVVAIFAPHFVKPTILLAIPGLALVLLNGVWIAMLLGMACLRFRDLQPLIANLIQVSIFITPIFWPPDVLSGSTRLIFVTFNPIYHLIEVIRAPLIGQVPPAASYVAVILMAAVGIAVTCWLFARFRRRLAYWS